MSEEVRGGIFLHVGVGRGGGERNFSGTVSRILALLYIEHLYLHCCLAMKFSWTKQSEIKVLASL